MTSTTMTVRLPAATKERLGRLAERIGRSRSFLAGEAIADYVERELAIIEGIERGVADMEAGRYPMTRLWRGSGKPFEQKGQRAVHRCRPERMKDADNMPM